MDGMPEEPRDTKIVALESQIANHQQRVEALMSQYAARLDQSREAEVAQRQNIDISLVDFDPEGSNSVTQQVHERLTGDKDEILALMAEKGKREVYETVCSDQRHAPTTESISTQTAGNIGDLVFVPEDIVIARSRGHQGIDQVSRCGACSGTEKLIEDGGIPELLGAGFPTVTIEFLAAEMLNSDEKFNALAQGLAMIKANDHLQEVQVIIDEHVTGAAYHIATFKRNQATSRLSLEYEEGEWGKKIKDEDPDWETARSGYVKGQDPEILALYPGASIAPREILETDRVFSISLTEGLQPAWGSLGYALNSARSGHGFESSNIVLFLLRNQEELNAILADLKDNEQSAGIAGQILELNKSRGLQVVAAIVGQDDIQLQEIKFTTKES